MLNLEEVIIDIIDIANGDKDKGTIIDEYYRWDNSINSMVRVMYINYKGKTLSEILVSPLNQVNFSSRKKYKVINIEDLIKQIK